MLRSRGQPLGGPIRFCSSDILVTVASHPVYCPWCLLNNRPHPLTLTSNLADTLLDR